MEPSLQAILKSGKIRTLGGLGGEGSGREVAPVGVEAIDRRLGGLVLGATHEWMGAALEGGRRPPWAVPLTLLAWVVARHRLDEDRAGLTVWIGRRVRPTPWLLLQTRGHRQDCLFVDVTRPDQRLWAIDQALRCRTVASVVGDASGFDLGASRRLQLAAEVGGTLGLLARPAWERDVLSASATRWMVSPCPGDAPSWRVALVRAKGMATEGCAWDVRWEARDGAHVVCLAPGVVGGSGAPEIGAPARGIA